MPDKKIINTGATYKGYKIYFKTDKKDERVDRCIKEFQVEMEKFVKYSNFVNYEKDICDMLDKDN